LTLLCVAAGVLLLLQYGYCRIDGNTGGDDREYMIDEYNKPDSSK
jgi:SNF2 family DNA or RNA helicase